MSATFSTVVQLAVVNPAEIRKFFDLKTEIPLSDEDIATRECPEMADHMKMEGNRHRFAICEFGVARPGLVREPRYLAPLEDSGSAHWTNCACSRHRFKCPTGNLATVRIFAGSQSYPSKLINPWNRASDD